MSVTLMAAVWNRLSVSGGDLNMALALADVADDDGTAIYPSVNRLCWKTRQGRRAVQRQLRKLQSIGWLELVAPGGGRNQPALYRIQSAWVNGVNLARLPDQAPFDWKTDYSVHSDPKPRQLRHETASPETPNSSVSILTHHQRSGFAASATEGEARRRLLATVKSLAIRKRADR